MLHSVNLLRTRLISFVTMKFSLALAGGSLLLGRALADLPTIETKVCSMERSNDYDADHS